MIILTQTTICDACKEPITSDDHVRYLNNHVHFHYDCGVKLNQWLRDHEDIDKYLSALLHSPKPIALTIRHFIYDTDEAKKLREDERYYLFIDNCDEGPYLCCCNHVRAIHAVIKGLNPHNEQIMAVFHKNIFYTVTSKLSIQLDDENGTKLNLDDTSAIWIRP